MAEQNLSFPDNLDLSQDTGEEMDQEIVKETIVDGLEGEEVDQDDPNRNKDEAGEGKKTELIIPGVNDQDDMEDSEKTPAWVKNLRKEHRELRRTNRELQKQLEAKNQDGQEEELEEKPTLEAFDHDDTKFSQALENWIDKKKRIESKKERQKAQQEQQEKEWNDKLEAYNQEVKKLNIPNFEELAAVVENTMSIPQLGMIIDGANNPARVVSVLGANPEKAEELAKIKHPVKFAFAVARLEAALKLPRKQNTPQPERKLKGNASISVGTDPILEKLRAEADKSGDRTKVAAYMKKKREASPKT